MADIENDQNNTLYIGHAIKGRARINPHLANEARLNAENFLFEQSPNLSSANGAGIIFTIILLVIGFLPFLEFFKIKFFYYCALILSIIIIVFRLLIIFFSKNKKIEELPNMPDIAPIYTILVAMYKEADVVEQLANSLQKLEWPKDRLDIIFICEEDDFRTISKIEPICSANNYRLLIMEEGIVKTKPRALQAALEFAIGDFIVIYDAEDRPHPQQLKQAFKVFIESDENLGVVQSMLIPTNHNESLISGLFCLDYAIWFQMILPFFAKMSGAIPLGGTSNHFRKSAIVNVGGWDPFNVTEDADLGIRLARNNYIAKIIPSPTFEEAPPKIGAWIRQRSRWIKGHIQTISVHAREPIKSLYQLGFWGSVSIVFSMVLGPIFASLRLPLMFILIFSFMMNGFNIGAYIALFSLSVEYIIGILAIMKDKRYSLALGLLFLPFYWLLQSIAFYRAAMQIFTCPHYWEKTMHGAGARL